MAQSAPTTFVPRVPAELKEASENRKVPHLVLLWRTGQEIIDLLNVVCSGRRKMPLVEGLELVGFILRPPQALQGHAVQKELPLVEDAIGKDVKAHLRSHGDEGSSSHGRELVYHILLDLRSLHHSAAPHHLTNQVHVIFQDAIVRYLRSHVDEDAMPD